MSGQSCTTYVSCALIEDEQKTYVVATLLTVIAETTGGTGLHRDAVADLYVLDLGADCMGNA